jgi:hypothetical protein
MSLFGLALGLGMLVDNATVVYENLSHQRPGFPGGTRGPSLGRWRAPKKWLSP